MGCRLRQQAPLFKKLGFIYYNGGLTVRRGLLSVVLHD
jgi:hypothetical protein